ncbi:MAG: NADH-quinone oxidoreductase subunit J [Deltaproteobacteria bacterium]|jgi:NADH-quinone oxidoreductase subunit J|nr:NADH-quinone oxidoreductase subunit J [Deltaproteobacteria bacterium]MBW2519301.1 NADH-quinone oxidoreductase subunit J [Deltaproteobacteria bacterium]
MEILFFYLVAFVTLVSGLLVIRCQSPVNSALALVNTFFCLAVFYVMLHAPFMAAIQIMVYAGAIMVLILFVIMLLNLGTESRQRYTRGVVWSSIASLLMLIVATVTIKTGQVTGAEGEITAHTVKSVGHTELIGRTMFTEFLLPFEIASILLLVAIVGAVVLAKKEV